MLTHRAAFTIRLTINGFRLTCACTGAAGHALSDHLASCRRPVMLTVRRQQTSPAESSVAMSLIALSDSMTRRRLWKALLVTSVLAAVAYLSAYIWWRYSHSATISARPDGFTWAYDSTDTAVPPRYSGSPILLFLPAVMADYHLTGREFLHSTAGGVAWEYPKGWFRAPRGGVP